MKHERYVALIARLEEYADNHPGCYRVRVAGLALIGYFYILTIAIGALSLVILLTISMIASGKLSWLAIKLCAIALPLALIALRSIWISLPTPQGRNLEPREVPLLSGLLEELAAKFESPTVDHIVLTEDFNAAIVQIPRFGFLGGGHNYLLLGLPLLHALTPTEFRAVLAHEFGHLSKAHGRFSAWIYRFRQTCHQLLVDLNQEKRHGAFIFNRFIEWYAPYFDAYSFVLARNQEYEADRCATEVVGKEMLASTLIKVELKHRMLEEEFFPEIYERVCEQPEPPAATYDEMYARLGGVLNTINAEHWLAEAIMKKSEFEDTHPTLIERLKAVGYEVSPNSGGLNHIINSVNSICDKTLVANLNLIEFAEQHTKTLNQIWKEGLTQSWRERYMKIRQAREKIREFKERTRQSQILSIEELWKMVEFVTEVDGIEAALPYARKILEKNPDHAGANFACGQALLLHEDEAGISHLDRAMELDPQSIIPSCEAVFTYLMEHGLEAEADAYRKRAAEHKEHIERARQERLTIHPYDWFEGHNLSPSEINALRQELATYSQIKAAYLVRKVMKYSPDHPFYVLGIVPKYRWYQRSNVKTERTLINSLVSDLKMPWDSKISISIIMLTKDFKYLRWEFRKIMRSKIYESGISRFELIWSRFVDFLDS